MVLAKMELWELYNGLLYNFLYNSDINSIHILLNLYDIETNITNIYPKYRCSKEIRRKIKRILFPRRDRQLVSNSVAMLLHEDIDRLELTLYLKGYISGYHDNKWVNILEDETIKHYAVDEIYGKNFLFHYDTSTKEIQDIVKKLYRYLELKEEESNSLENIIISYCQKIIKKKIYNLNSYTDKQLTMSYNLKNLNIQEEPLLSTSVLDSIYKSVVKSIDKNIIKTYKEAYWFGINDRLLNRYL